jgi:1,4-alpha-glucan branching enzyme
MAPTDFWFKALRRVDSIAPVIKLAEAWEPELMARGFDAAYGWDFHHILNAIAQGKKKITDMDDFTKKADSIYAPDDMLMHFITNHDENSWAGTEYERMGKYVPGFAVITYLMPGIPLIYTGQEAKLKKRLQFFEKDEVPFIDTTLYSFYRTLNTLKHRNPALWAGINAGDLSMQADSVSQFTVILRTSGNDKVLGIFNFSDKKIQQKITIPEAYGKYQEVFSGTTYKISKNKSVALEPWEFLVLEQ